MKSKFSEADVLNLLGGLKNAESNYPTEMIASRRNAYIKQAASMGFLIQAGKNGHGTQSVSGTATSGNMAAPAMGKVLEIALAIAILAEAGVVTYLYRYQISEWINNLVSPRIEQGVNPTDDSTLPIKRTSTANTETATAMPTDTPVVTVTDGTPAPFTAPNESSSSETSGPNNQVESTEVPKDNPGNHYGNTPKPDRTKEPSPNNNNNGNKGNNK